LVGDGARLISKPLPHESIVIFSGLSCMKSSTAFFVPGQEVNP
jgi:hypothetical protein